MALLLAQGAIAAAPVQDVVSGSSVPHVHASRTNNSRRTARSGSIVLRPDPSFSSSLSSGIMMTRSRKRIGMSIDAAMSLPLVPPSNHWGMWSVLLSIAAFGIWSEKTDWGSTLSGALVSTLVGLAASNTGLIASHAPAFTIVNQYLLPLSVPLLLLSADLRVVVASTGRLLLAFCLGSDFLSSEN